MSTGNIIETTLGSLEKIVLPTKRLRDAEAIQSNKQLVLKRGELPEIRVIEHPGSSHYLVVLGNRLIAGAVLACEEDPSLASLPVRLRVIRQDVIRTSTKTYTRLELVRRLLRGAEKAGWSVDGVPHVEAFRQRARAVLSRLGPAETAETGEADDGDGPILYEETEEIPRHSGILQNEALRRLAAMLEDDEDEAPPAENGPEKP